MKTPMTKPTLDQALKNWCATYLNAGNDVDDASYVLTKLVREYNQDADLMTAERDREFDL